MTSSRSFPFTTVGAPATYGSRRNLMAVTLRPSSVSSSTVLTSKYRELSMNIRALLEVDQLRDLLDRVSEVEHRLRILCHVRVLQGPFADRVVRALVERVDRAPDRDLRLHPFK